MGVNQRFSKSQVRLGEVFRRYLADYCRGHKLSQFQRKVVQSIQACRTEEMGGQIEVCSECEHKRERYLSCRNRHCPTCQGKNRYQWVKRRVDELLPIPYYHVIFTMPHSLNLLALYNKAVIYDIFFKAAAHTLEVFAKDRKFLGGRLGYIGILHTWGQTLSHHIHLHFIVSGGGLSADGKRWLHLPYREEFIFPTPAMSKRMRKRFAELLDEAYRAGKLVFPGELSQLSGPYSFSRFSNEVAWQSWYIYTKKPFAGPQEVVQYISRYTHRVAISNSRLIDIENGTVTFSYKQYKKNEKPVFKTMALESEKFIGRFLWHILPKGFKRIRHFGFLGSGCKREKLAVARQLLQAFLDQLKEAYDSVIEIFDFSKCPVCKKGFMNLLEVIAPCRLVPG